MPLIIFCVRPDNHKYLIELVKAANEPGNLYQWKYQIPSKGDFYELVTLVSSESHIRNVRSQLQASDSLVNVDLPGFVNGISPITWPVDPSFQ